MRLALRPEARSGLMASTCSGGSDAALQVEGAVMSLSAWERQTLDSIGSGLADSDPELATLLTTFARLASGEEMPAREKVHASSRRVARRSRPEPRLTRRPHRRLGSQQAVMLLWLVITVALIATALASSHGGSQGTCARSWATSCIGAASAPSPVPGIR